MQPTPHPRSMLAQSEDCPFQALYSEARLCYMQTYRMKRPLFSVVAAFLFSSVFALAGDTAYDALRAAGARLGADAQNRLVEISGRGGRPQPVLWQVQLEEASGRSGLVQVNVQRGVVVGQSRPGGAPMGGRLNLAAIQLDSDGAFTIANTEAIRSDISFDRLNYLLKLEGGFPVWRIELLDGPASIVGSLKISADTGAVIERSPQLALSEDDRMDAKWSKPGERFKSVADFFHRTGKKIGRTGYQLRNWANGDGWTDAKNP